MGSGIELCQFLRLFYLFYLLFVCPLFGEHDNVVTIDSTSACLCRYPDFFPITIRKVI